MVSGTTQPLSPRSLPSKKLTFYFSPRLTLILCSRKRAKGGEREKEADSPFKAPAAGVPLSFTVAPKKLLRHKTRLWVDAGTARFEQIRNHRS